MELTELTGASKLDEFQAKEAYLATCDIKAYLDMLVEKTHDETLYPASFMDVFRQMEDAYDATSDPHLTPELAKQLMSGINEARKNDAFAMNENQLHFDLVSIKAAL